MAGSTVISCRGCLSEVKPTGFYSFQWPEIKDLFVACTSVAVQTDEHGLPQQICTECYNKCEQWHSFRSLCQDTNKHLLESQSILDPPNVEVEVAVKEEVLDDPEICFGELIPDSPPGEAAFLTPNVEAVFDGETGEKAAIQCPVCQLGVGDTMALKEHLPEHCSEESPECPICQFSFDTASEIYPHVLSVHMKMHPNEVEMETQGVDMETVTGEIQPLSVVNEPSMNNAVVHNPDHPFQCNYCQLTFRFKGSIIRHLRKKHRKLDMGEGIVERENARGATQGCAMDPSWDPLTVCPICNATPGVVWKHILEEHVGTDPTVCPICHKDYLLKCKLIDHLIRHTKEYSILCPMCNKGYESQGALKVHFVVHTLELPYECRLCGKDSTKKGDIQSHLKKRHPGYKKSRGVRIKVGSIFHHPRPWESMGYTLNEPETSLWGAIEFNGEEMEKEIKTEPAEQTVSNGKEASVKDAQDEGDTLTAIKKPKKFECIFCNKKFVGNGWLQNHMRKCQKMYQDSC